jgi:hypothetical protein
MELLFLLIVLAVVSACIVLVGLKMRRRIPKAVRVRIERQWAHVSTVADTHRRVLEAEKVLDALLTELGFRGTFAEKLGAVAPRLADPEALWRAHKLRNRIAHEPGLTLTDEESRRAVRAFESALNRLLG